MNLLTWMPSPISFPLSISLNSLWVAVAFWSFPPSTTINSQRSDTLTIHDFSRISLMLCMCILCIVDLFIIYTTLSLHFPCQSINSGDDLISIWREVNPQANRQSHCEGEEKEGIRSEWDQSLYSLNPSVNVVIIWLFFISIWIHYIRHHTQYTERYWGPLAVLIPVFQCL